MHPLMEAVELVVEIKTHYVFFWPPYTTQVEGRSVLLLLLLLLLLMVQYMVRKGLLQ